LVRRLARTKEDSVLAACATLNVKGDPANFDDPARTLHIDPQFDLNYISYVELMHQTEPRDNH